MRLSLFNFSECMRQWFLSRIGFLQELLKPITEQITIGAIPPESIDMSYLKCQQIKGLGKLNDNAKA